MKICIQEYNGNISTKHNTIINIPINKQYKIYVDNILNCILSILDNIQSTYVYIDINMIIYDNTTIILNQIDTILKDEYDKVYIALSKNNKLCAYLENYGYDCNKSYLYGKLFNKKLK